MDRECLFGLTLLWPMPTMIGTSLFVGSAALLPKNEWQMQTASIDFWSALKNVYSYIGFCFARSYGCSSCIPGPVADGDQGAADDDQKSILVLLVWFWNPYVRSTLFRRS